MTKKTCLLVFLTALLGMFSALWAATLYVGPGQTYTTIQAAIDAANPEGGDVIQVAAGEYHEYIDVNKRVSIIGAGSGSDTASNTIIYRGAVQPPVDPAKYGVIQLNASGLDNDHPIELQNFRVCITDIAGISVGKFCLATGVNVSYYALDNIQVWGTNMNPATEQQRGFYVDLTSDVSHITFNNCQFNNMTYGWYFQKQVSADTSSVSYLTATNCVFNHNNHKGIYAEKLDHALFTGCSAANNGYDASVLPTYFYDWCAGFDINLKAGTYSNIEFNSCTLTANGIGGSKEGAGLAIKGRSDGGYSTYPATLNNVAVTNCIITGNERGIRFGEPGKNNPTPTNVIVSGGNISNNRMTYTLGGGSAYGDIVNATSNSASISVNGAILAAGKSIINVVNGGSIQAAIDAATAGDIIHVANGTYPITSEYAITKSLTIIGESEAGTIIDRSTGSGYGLDIQADNFTMKNFTILPNSDTTYGYTIKASFNHTAPYQPHLNLTLENITISGSKKTAFDIHGYNNVVLNNLTATNTVSGVGVALTGCDGVTLTGVNTSGNAWAGVAAFVSKSGYLNRGSNNINIDYSQNTLTDLFYSQDEEGLVNTNINVTGYTYGIGGGGFFSYTMLDLPTALVAAANPVAFVWAAGDPILNYYVGPGMSIQAAINAATVGDVINVAAGLYQEDVVINKDLSLLGAKSSTPRNTGSSTDWTTSTTATWDNAAAVAAGEAVIRSINTTTKQSVIDIAENCNVVLKGFVIEARNRTDGTDRHLVYVIGQDATIQNVTIENNIIGPITGLEQNGAEGRMGLNFDSQRGGYNGLSGSVKNNKILGAEGNGNNIFVIGSHYNPSFSDYSGMTIENNDVYGTNRVNVELCGGLRGITVQNNYIDHAGYIWNGTEYVMSAASIAAPAKLNYGTGITMIRTGTIVNVALDTQNRLEDITISNNTIMNSQKMGIYSEAMIDDIIVDQNTISGSGWRGIWLDESGTFNAPKANAPAYGYTGDIAITGNSLTANATGILVTGKPPYFNCEMNTIAGNTTGMTQEDGTGQTWVYAADATNNWWGHATGPSHPVTNPLAEGNPVSDDVLYDPWYISSDMGETDSNAPVENVTQNLFSYTIQSAIDTAVESDVIVINGGTYNENLVIDTPVTLMPSGRDPVVINGSGTGSVITVDADGVEITGLTIQGSGSELNDAGIYIMEHDSTNIHGNVIQNNASGILLAYGTGNHFTANEIHNNDFYGIGLVAADINTVDANNIFANGLDGIALENGDKIGHSITDGANGNFITGNTIISNNDGIFIGKNCTGNSFTDGNDIEAGSSGMNIWHVGNQTITGNTFHDSVIGIRLLGSTDNTITRNTITQNTKGIVAKSYYDDDDPVNCTGNTIQYNKIFGNTGYGVDAIDNGGIAVAATPNWWGDAAGPDAPDRLGNAVTTNVTYDPWWADEAMTILDSNMPVINITHPASYSTIQAAIDAAVPGDVIEIQPGSYIEQIHVATENLTLQGVDKDTVIIQSPATLEVIFYSPSPNRPIVFVDGVQNFTITDLTIDGNKLGNNNFRMVGIGFGNAGGHVENVDITNIMNEPFDGQQYGVGLYASINTPDNNYTISVDTVTITNFQKNGMAFFGNATTHNLAVYLNNVTAIGQGPTTIIGQNGISVARVTGSITNCHISDVDYTPDGTEAAGILLAQNSTGVSVTGNTMTNCEVGVYSEYGTDLTIQGNNITGSSNSGIYDQFGVNSTINQNNVSTSYRGIWCDLDTSGDTITENDLSGNDYGLVLNGTGHTVTDNTFANNAIHVNNLSMVPMDMQALASANTIDQYVIVGQIIYSSVAELYVGVPDEVIPNSFLQTYSVKATQISNLRAFTVKVKIPKADFLQPVHTGDPIDFAIGSAYDGYELAMLEPILFTDNTTDNTYDYTVSGAYFGGYDGITGTDKELLKITLTSKEAPYTNVTAGADGCYIQLVNGDVVLKDDLNPPNEITCLGTVNGLVVIDGANPVIAIDNLVTDGYNSPVPYIIKRDGNGMIIPTFDLTYTDDYDLFAAKYIILPQTADAPLPGAFTSVVAPVNGILTDVDNWALPIGAMTDGTYTIYFLAVDEAGNYSILDWDFMIDITAPDPIVWDELIPCRTTPKQNNSIDLKWTNPAGAVKNHIWYLSYASLPGASAYPEYTNATNYTVTNDIAPYTAGPSTLGWTKGPEIDRAAGVVTYPWTPTERGYYYITVYVEDASGNLSAAPVAPFYRESISYWPGDVTGTADGIVHTVTSADIGLLSGAWGSVDGDAAFNNIIDVGPTVDNARRSRPTPDNVINIEDLMIFAMNYNNTVYTFYPRDPDAPQVVPIRIEMISRYEGSELVVELSLAQNAGFVRALNIPLSFGTGLSFSSALQGDIWPTDSVLLSKLVDNTVELSISTLGFESIVEGNGLIAELRFAISDADTSIELLPMIARAADNTEIVIENNPTGPTEGEDPVNVIPTVSYLGNCYPNPFNPTTNIQYGLKEAARVQVNVYNARGQLVKELVNSTQPAGTYNLIWNGQDNDGRSVSSGIYFFRMITADKVQTKKAILMK